MKTKNDLLATLCPKWKPPPRKTVSEWADTTRKLSSESSAIPGQWRTRIVEYAREPMDCVSDPRVNRVVIMAAAQVAKSEILLNVAGWMMDYDPSPMLMLQPTIDMAEAFSKDRVGPMIRDTPALKKIIRSNGGRRGQEDTIKQKKFPGGHLTMIGANAPSSLASRPIRAVLCDEVDRYPVSAGKEGDPVLLAAKRSVTFWNKLLMLVSTPVDKNTSRIEAAYEQGDGRQYWVPCPHCGEHQVMKWSQIKFKDRNPDTARYECEHCGEHWTDTTRIAAIRKGEWRAQREFYGTASFHITGMMSPFTMMSDGVREFLEAQGKPEQLKVWTNTYLGETWEDQGERVDTHSLMDRREKFDHPVPENVTLLTAGADVQDDRIEVEVVGWGDNSESWSVGHKVFYGDPSGVALWSSVRNYLGQMWHHPLFGDIEIRATCLDTAGHYTKNAYDFVRANHRVYGIKGIGGEGKPMVGTPSRNNYGKIPLFPLGTFALKETVVARLKAAEGEAGRCHFPIDREEEYFNQMTSEMLTQRFHKGYRRREWVKIRARNEAFDLRVYATAALELLNVDLIGHRKALLRETQRDVKEEDEKRSSGRKKSSFVNSWKR